MCDCFGLRSARVSVSVSSRVDAHLFVSGTLSVSRQTACPRKPLPALRETRHTLSTGHSSFSLGAAQGGSELLPSPRCGSKKEKTRPDCATEESLAGVKSSLSSNKISPPVTGCSCANLLKTSKSNCHFRWASPPFE